MTTKSAQSQVKNAIKIAWRQKAKIETKKSVSDKRGDHIRFALTLPGPKLRTWGAFGTIEACWISFWFGKVIPLIREALLAALRDHTDEKDPAVFVHGIEAGIIDPPQAYKGPQADMIHALACALSPRTNGITLKPPPADVDLHDGQTHNPLENQGTDPPIADFDFGKDP
jgi:hypothetical protein